MTLKDTIKTAINLAELVAADHGPPAFRSGDKLFWCCPFHAKTRASFCVYPDNSWHCFGACDTGGDVFAYLMKQHGISFKDALQRAASMAGVTGGAAATLYRPEAGRTGTGPAIRLNEPPAGDWQERAVLAMVDGCVSGIVHRLS